MHIRVLFPCNKDVFTFFNMRTAVFSLILNSHLMKKHVMVLSKSIPSSLAGRTFFLPLLHPFLSRTHISSVARRPLQFFLTITSFDSYATKTIHPSYNNGDASLPPSNHPHPPHQQPLFNPLFRNTIQSHPFFRTRFVICLVHRRTINRWHC